MSSLFVRPDAQAIGKCASAVVSLLFLLLVVCSPSTLSVTAQSTACTTSNLVLFFKPYNDPGRSYLTLENTQPTSSTNFYMQASTAISPFTVYVGNNAVSPIKRLGAASSGAYVVSASCVPDCQFAGSSAVVHYGKALFDALTPGSVTVSNSAYDVYFSLLDATASTVILNQTLRVVFRTSNPPASSRSLDFSTAVGGFFSYVNVIRTDLPTVTGNLSSFVLKGTKVIPVNVVLPNSAVQVVTGYGAVESATVFSGSVTCTGGTMAFSPIGGTGTVTLSNLKFSPTSTTLATTTCTITLTDPSNLAIRMSISLRLQQQPASCRFLRFATSNALVPSEGSPLSVVMDVAVPTIAVHVLTSQLELDTRCSGFLIVASSPDGGEIEGGHALVESGVATFSYLSVIGAPTQSAIVFTATSYSVGSPYDASFAVTGERLVTGATTVSQSAVRGSYLRFASSSEVQSDKAMSIVIDNVNSFTLPLMIVKMLDSSFRFDPTASGVPLQIQLQGSTAVIASGGTASMDSGIAAFGNVQFSSGSEGTTFTICVTNPSGLRAPLCSGPITLVTSAQRGSLEDMITRCVSHTVPIFSTTSASTSCGYRIQFDQVPLSLIGWEGQRISATLGQVLPEVRILLKGPVSTVTGFSTSQAPLVYAYTGESPFDEKFLDIGTQLGRWRGTYYSFSCLRFTRKPTGLVTLKFTMLDPADSETFFLNQLTSGFVAIAAGGVQSAFDLRFSPQNILFSYAGQSLAAAMLQTALPSITIEILKSDGTVDLEANGMVVVATTSLGARLRAEGSMEVVQDGRATFQLLAFTEAGDEPTLTFQVEQTLSPVQGKSISTGRMFVFPGFLPCTSMTFRPILDDQNNISYPFEPFVFPRMDEMLLTVSVVFRNADGSLASSASKAITVTQTAEEVVFSSTQVASIAAGAAAGALFQAQIVSFVSDAADGAPVFLRYKVTDSGSVFLVGQELIVGPLFFADKLLNSRYQLCSIQHSFPVVSALFQIPLSQFNLTDAVASLNAKLAVSSVNVYGTVLPLAVEVGTGIDSSSLSPWTGTKLVFLFGRGSSSTDRSASLVETQRSSTALAQAIVAYQPTCQSGTLNSYSSAAGDSGFRTAVYTIDDSVCDAESFRQSLIVAQNCSRSGYFPACQCYTIFALGPYGAQCSINPTLFDSFTAICSVLNDCTDISILSACVNFTPDEGLSKAVYAALAALVVIPIAIAAYCLYKRRQAQQVLLNRERQIAIEKEAGAGWREQLSRWKQKVSDMI